MGDNCSRRFLRELQKTKTFVTTQNHQQTLTFYQNSRMILKKCSLEEEYRVALTEKEIVGIRFQAWKVMQNSGSECKRIRPVGTDSLSVIDKMRNMAVMLCLKKGGTTAVRSSFMMQVDNEDFDDLSKTAGLLMLVGRCPGI